MHKHEKIFAVPTEADMTAEVLSELWQKKLRDFVSIISARIDNLIL